MGAKTNTKEEKEEEEESSPINSLAFFEKESEAFKLPSTQAKLRQESFRLKSDDNRFDYLHFTWRVSERESLVSGKLKRFSCPIKDLAEFPSEKKKKIEAKKAEEDLLRAKLACFAM